MGAGRLADGRGLRIKVPVREPLSLQSPFGGSKPISGKDSDLRCPPMLKHQGTAT